MSLSIDPGGIAQPSCQQQVPITRNIKTEASCDEPELVLNPEFCFGIADVGNEVEDAAPGDNAVRMDAEYVL